MDTASLRAQLAETHRTRRGQPTPVSSIPDTLPAAEFDTAEGYATRMAKSGLLLPHFRLKPENILWATEFARMLHVDTMAVMLGVYVVQGRPCSTASFIGGLVRRAGHKLHTRGGESWRDRAFSEIIRSDDPDFVFRSDWTIQRAQESYLVEVVEGRPYARDEEGRPKPWERYAPALLKARTVTEVARDACQDVLFGLHYTAEELGADIDEYGRPTGRMLDMNADTAHHLDQALTADEIIERARAHAQPPIVDPAPGSGNRERIVIDRSEDARPDDVEAADPIELTAGPMNWDLAIQAAARNGVEALHALRQVAGYVAPDNQELTDRIDAAGQRFVARTREEVPARTAEPRLTDDPAASLSVPCGPNDQPPQA